MTALRWIVLGGRVALIPNRGNENNGMKGLYVYVTSTVARVYSGASGSKSLVQPVAAVVLLVHIATTTLERFNSEETSFVTSAVI
jgi:hypothetical protein